MFLILPERWPESRPNLYGAPMNIPAAQIQYRRPVGRSGSRSVYQVGVIGGLHLVAAHGAGGLEILGAGSHPAVARFNAKRQAPDLEFDDLAKSEPYELADYQHLIDQYWQVTQDLRALHAARKK